MRTEIYGTFGPACAAQETLESMFHAGMTGMRLNLSHVDLADSAAQIDAFHAAAAAVGVIPQLVVDTQGPELRIGGLRAPLLLENDDIVAFGPDGIPVPEVVLSALEPGGKCCWMTERSPCAFSPEAERRSFAAAP